jgi:hypothetical protein
VYRDPDSFAPSTSFPPSLVARNNDTPLGAILQLSAPAGDDAGVGTPEVSVDVTVLDPDVDQRLEWRVYVNYELGTINELPRRDETLPPTQGRDLARPLGFTLRGFELDPAPSCNRVELFVAPRFGALNLQPRDDASAGDDFAVATWWVARPTEGLPLDVALCTNAGGVRE